MAACALAAGISLRRLVAGDRPFLEALYRSVRWDELAPTGWPDQTKIAFLAQQFDLQHRQYQATFAGADFWIVERDGAPVGRFYVDRTGRDLHLVEISLITEQRGAGLGSALIGRLQQEVRAGRARSVGLSVDRDNLGARRLYRRLGFVDAPSDLPYPGASIAMTWPPAGPDRPGDAEAPR
jgi:ribosomal protein S18 acetylase RimI-like enzyme